VFYVRYTSLGSTYNTFRNPALLVSPSPQPSRLVDMPQTHPHSLRSDNSTSLAIPQLSTLTILSLDPESTCEYLSGSVPDSPATLPEDEKGHGEDNTATSSLPDIRTLDIISPGTNEMCYVEINNISSEDGTSHCCHSNGQDTQCPRSKTGSTGSNGVVSPLNGTDRAGPGAGDSSTQSQRLRYRPAYELTNGEYERLGRGTRPPVISAP